MIDGIGHHDQQRPVGTQGRIDRFQVHRLGRSVVDRLAAEESSCEIFEGVQPLVGEHENMAFGAQDAISPLSSRAEMQCRRLIAKEVTYEVDRTIESKRRHGEREAVDIQRGNIDDSHPLGRPRSRVHEQDSPPAHRCDDGAALRAGHTMRAPIEDGSRNVPPAGSGHLQEGDIVTGAHSHETAGERNPVDSFLRRRDCIGADHLGPIQAHELNPAVVRAEPVARLTRAASRPGHLEIRQADRADVHALVAAVGNHQR